MTYDLREKASEEELQDEDEDEEEEEEKRRRKDEEEEEEEEDESIGERSPNAEGARQTLISNVQRNFGERQAVWLGAGSQCLRKCLKRGAANDVTGA